jgi:hypothetical protein
VPFKAISPLASHHHSNVRGGGMIHKRNSEMVKCVEDIEEMRRPLLENLRKIIFRKQEKVATRISATMNKHVEMYIYNKEDKKEGVGAN